MPETGKWTWERGRPSRHTSSAGPKEMTSQSRRNWSTSSAGRESSRRFPVRFRGVRETMRHIFSCSQAHRPPPGSPSPFKQTRCQTPGFVMYRTELSDVGCYNEAFLGDLRLIPLAKRGRSLVRGGVVLKNGSPCWGTILSAESNKERKVDAEGVGMNRRKD